MKKIATITFHWAKNYGAVLQAFALQQHLKKSGFETEIINYLPMRTIVINLLAALKNCDIDFLKKISKFKKFRKNELSVSSKKYFSNKALFGCKDEYSAVITGSDQIWNMSFTSGAEGKPTLSYYLNFAGDNTKRISYASSFGAVKFYDGVPELIKPELEKYSAISVREKTAVAMLKEIGIDAVTVADPTLLLEADDYEKLLQNRNFNIKDDICTYIIHSNQQAAHKISNYVNEKYSKNPAGNTPIKSCDVYEWLYRIKNSEYVVTNSFHGTVFSIIFHKPFIAVKIPGSGMNDRLTTLLETVGLSEHFVEEFDPCEIDTILQKKIDWDKVDTNKQKLKSFSQAFLTEALSK